jgi:hypothetical protein
MESFHIGSDLLRLLMPEIRDFLAAHTDDPELAVNLYESVVANLGIIASVYPVCVDRSLILESQQNSEWNNRVQESIKEDSFYGEEGDSLDLNSLYLDNSELEQLLANLKVVAVNQVPGDSHPLDLANLSKLAQRILVAEIAGTLVLLFESLLNELRLCHSAGEIIIIDKIIGLVLVIVALSLGQTDGASAAGLYENPLGQEANSPVTTSMDNADPEDDEDQQQDQKDSPNSGNGSENADSQNAQPSNSAVPKPKTQQHNHLVNIQEIARLIAGSALPSSGIAYTALDVFKPPFSLMVAIALLGLDYIFADRPVQIFDGISAGKTLGNDELLVNNLPNLVIEWNTEINPELRPALKATIGLSRDPSDKRSSNAEFVITLPPTIDLKYEITGLPSTSILTTSLTMTGLPSIRSTNDSTTTSLASTNLTSISRTITDSTSTNLRSTSLPSTDLPMLSSLVIGLPTRDPLIISAELPIYRSERDSSISYRVIDNPAIIISNPPIVTDSLVTQPSTINVTITNPIVANLIVVDPIVANSIVIEPTVSTPIVSTPIVANQTIANQIVTNLSVTDPIATNRSIVDSGLSIDNSTIDKPSTTNQPTVTNLVVTNPTVTDPISTNPPISNSVGSPAIDNSTIDNPPIPNQPIVTNPSIVINPPIEINPPAIDPPAVIDSPSVVDKPPTIVDNYPQPEPQPYPTIDKPTEPKSCFNDGTFVVDNSGQISIDFLYDGGFYEGELAIVNLTGMEQFIGDSNAFIQEALRRASSQSDLGYIVISDRNEGAKYGAWDFASDSFNTGSYLGMKTFQMKAGSQFGLMLIPNSTVKETSNTINLADDQRPVFSFEANGSMQNLFGNQQFTDVTPSNSKANRIVAIEDMSGVRSDNDFNDLIVGIGGSVSSGTTRWNPSSSPLDLQSFPWYQAQIQTHLDRYK